MNAPGRPGGTYFFLSYAHSPPTSDGEHTDVDPSVHRVYTDLNAKVGTLATPGSTLDGGFIDSQLPPGSDWKESLAAALGATEVLVPLYSPGYFRRSWPMSELRSFRRRLDASPSPTAERHILPVLWLPLPSGSRLPEVQQAIEVAPQIAAYAEHGLRRLLSDKSYREPYMTILDRLARRIVDIAEHTPLGPSRAPALDELPESGLPGTTGGRGGERPFVIAVVAPTARSQPPDRRARGEVYGTETVGWRPFADGQSLPIAEHCADVAQRLGLPTAIVDGFAGQRLDEDPGLLLVDPWVLDRPEGAGQLTATVERLPEWFTAVVVVDRGDPQFAERGAALATVATDLLSNAGTHRVRETHDVRGFVKEMPTIIAEARREYLRKAPLFPPKGPHVPRRRLRDLDDESGVKNG